MRPRVPAAPLLPLLLALVFVPVVPSPAAAAPLETFDALPSFPAPPAAGARAVAIDSLVLDVGRGRARLGRGTLVALPAPGGTAHAALFVGPARFEYRPELPVERNELRRAVGGTSWERDVDAAVIVAADGALAAALAGGAVTAVPAPAAKPVIEALAKRLAGDDGDAWDGLWRALLQGADDGYRWVAGFEAGRAASVLQFDPAERDASSLSLKDADSDDLLLVSREPVPGAAGGGFLRRRPAFEPEAVAVDATIADDLGARVTTTVQARMHEAGPAWIPFGLTDDVTVDSVLVDGNATPFGRRKESSRVWVRVPAGIERGMASDFRFVTHGKILERTGDWIALKSSVGWLPVHDPWQRVSYTLSFRSPRAYRLVAVGDLAASTTEGNTIVSRWVLARPSRNPTFAIGPFDETRLDDPRLPPLTVLMSKSMQKQVRADYGEDEVGGDLSKQAIADLANSQKFFRTLFGDPPDTTVVAAEIPYLHGEAFPGLVNLTWATFSDVTDRTLPMHLRAHEMAHQWWPLGADFATERDQWLSEGMADFCALWFAQVAAGDPRGYFERLDTWRKDLLPRRWRAAGNPEEASALALGWRIRAHEGRGAREAVLYHKGAWVLHMLRGLMLDPRTLRDDRFAAFLRETYRTYRGRSMSTKDVQAVAERHAGEDLGWFFTQWVEGSAIPTYRWAWRKEKQADGRWKAEVRVRAAETPEDFRMPVPVRLDLGEGRGVRFRVDVAGAAGASTLEGLESEPKALAFNDLAGVLCEAKEEPW